MAKQIKYRMTGPGRVLDRSVKKGKLTLAMDVSPNAFITECQRENGRLTLRIEAPETGIEPIEVLLEPKSWRFVFEKACIPKGQLTDLEFLIIEEEDIQATLEWTPEPKLTDKAE